MALSSISSLPCAHKLPTHCLVGKVGNPCPASGELSDTWGSGLAIEMRLAFAVVLLPWLLRWRKDQLAITSVRSEEGQGRHVCGAEENLIVCGLKKIKRP